MGTGERIHHFRKRMKMTQRYLGQLLGFPANSADVRMAQYESEDRNPKADLTAQMAQIFGVSPHAISVPDVDSYVGLMHTLFTLEDRYGLYVEESEGDVCLRVNLRDSQQAAELHRMLYEWQAAANALKKGEITQEAYDQWRYNFPDGDTANFGPGAALARSFSRTFTEKKPKCHGEIAAPSRAFSRSRAIDKPTPARYHKLAFTHTQDRATVETDLSGV